LSTLTSCSINILLLLLLFLCDLAGGNVLNKKELIYYFYACIR